MKALRARLIPLIVVIALLTGGYIVDRNRNAARSVLSGTFESQPSRLAPKISGRVARILVKEGDTVKKGQPLVVLSAPDVASQAESTAAQASEAKAKEAEAMNGSRKEDIARQEAVVAEAQATLTKLVNGPLPEEIKAADHRAKEAFAKLQELKRGSRPEEIEEARGAERAAYAQLQIARRGPSPEDKERLAEDLKAAESNLSLAQVQRDRKQRLYDQGAVAKADLDAAQNAYETALARKQQAALALERAQKGSPPEETRVAEEGYRQAKARLDLAVKGPRVEDIQAANAEYGAALENLKLLQRGSRAEDIAAARAQVDQAQAALKELVNGTRAEEKNQAKAASQAAEAQAKGSAATADERTIYAPKDGIVERILVADGDLVGPTAPAIQFSDPTDIWLRVYLPEKDLAKVKAGDEADLAIDGLNDLIPATVESVSTQGEFTPANLQTPEERGKQVFAIRIRLKSPDPRVKAGMAVTVKKLGAWSS